jgi:hypothetical protein
VIRSAEADFSFGGAAKKPSDFFALKETFKI